jgi:DNA modification methylase
MNITDVELKSLEFWPGNARAHNERNLEAIRQSLEKFGQVEPLVVQAGTNRVIGGNGRLQVLRAAGHATAKAYVVALSDSDASALNVALNRTSELAEWDSDALRQQLEALQAEGFEMDATGFDSEELERLLAAGNTGQGDPDETEEVPDDANVYVERGGLYVLGHHRILCGDATSADDVQRVLDGALADICWTDPPWNVAYGKSDHPSYRKREIANDDLGEAFPGFCAAFCASIKAATKPGAALYMAMSAQEWPVLDAALRHAGFHWSASIIWAKDSLVLGRGDYHRQYEPIWYGWNEDAARLHPLEDRKQSDLWNIDRPKKSEEHPTMKPVELVARALQNSSEPAGVVFEPFSGSGTTIIAAEQTGRRCRAIELEPKYVQCAIERWQKFTGQKARKE